MSTTQSLKYFVQRTKVGKNLPIYTEYRNGGNQCYTLIKKVSGDCGSLSEDLSKYFSSEMAVGESSKSASKKDFDIKNKWKIRKELGHIWVHGNHTGLVRKFLESKGF